MKKSRKEKKKAQKITQKKDKNANRKSALLLFGIPVKIHPLLFILFPLCAYLDCLPRFLCHLTLVFLHECCHVAAAYFLRIRVREIALTPLGCTALWEYEAEGSPWREATVAFMGPLFHLCMLSLAYVLCFLWGIVWPVFTSLNLLLFVINLLPVYPLDGGRILRCALSFLPKKTVRIVQRGIQILCSLIFLAYFIHRLFAGTIHLPSLICVLFFLFQREEKQEAFSLLHQRNIRLSSLHRFDALPIHSLAVFENCTVHRALSLGFQRGMTLYVIYNREGKEKGVLTQTALEEAYLAGRGSQTLSTLLPIR